MLHEASENDGFVKKKKKDVNWAFKIGLNDGLGASERWAAGNET